MAHISALLVIESVAVHVRFLSIDMAMRLVPHGTA